MGMRGNKLFVLILSMFITNFYPLLSQSQIPESTVNYDQNTEYKYDNRNRIIQSNDHEYQHDPDGNLIEDKNTKTGETKKFFYSSENHLLRYEHVPNGSSVPDIVAEYKYDFSGRRLQKKVNGVVTNFGWEGDNLAYELDGNFNPIRRYFYSSGTDEVEGYLEYSEAAAFPLDSSKKGWYTYIKDQVGTPYKVYNNFTKQIVDIRGYDSFGNLIHRTGSSTGNLGFQGKYFDSESGLYYFNNRYYNPEIGRFTSEDPIGLNGGINPYRFVNNNPINLRDPYGLITDLNSFASPNPRWPIPRQRMPINKAFNSVMSESFTELKQLICGDNFCDNRSGWQKFADNFILTNLAIPGMFAPAGIDIFTAKSLTQLTESITFWNWVRSGFQGFVLGGASFTALETGIIAGMTSLFNSTLVSISWETGVLVGSALKALICN
ncbi:MAG: RHS repeat-associated core domain-containing protein [Candidatus Omnitrophota bacterium]